MGEKMLFENTARVPLIIHDPTHPVHIRVTTPVELIDVYPTAVALAGFAVPDGLDGTSLLPLVRGDRLDAPKLYAFSQYPRCSKMPNVIPHTTCLEVNETDFNYFGCVFFLSFFVPPTYCFLFVFMIFYAFTHVYRLLLTSIRATLIFVSNAGVSLTRVLFTNAAFDNSTCHLVMLVWCRFVAHKRYVIAVIDKFESTFTFSYFQRPPACCCLPLCEQRQTHHIVPHRYSVRSNDWRYTEWRTWVGEELHADWTSSPIAVELYNHTGHHADSDLTFDRPQINLAAVCQTNLAPVCVELASALQAQFNKQ